MFACLYSTTQSCGKDIALTGGFISSKASDLPAPPRNSQRALKFT
uniref:Uncharacterized protein n=1 Tax=Anguilla anguilla TaxID=7936 RepID=A0A0E9TYC0_ANGAN